MFYKEEEEWKRKRKWEMVSRTKSDSWNRGRRQGRRKAFII